MNNLEKIEKILRRGVENIYPSPELLKKTLIENKKLRIYSGIDPTGNLHLGHLVIFNKLRQFQELGHEIIVLIGNFTALIGDPTGKSKTRKPLTDEEIKKNSANYKKLIGKILDLKKTKFVYNKDWIDKLKASDFIKLASYFTVSRLLERDMFQERIKNKEEIYLHEFIYPIFQAYDSVVLDVDMEIGGNDQTFNMLAGRTLMRKMKKTKEKFVLATKLLTDSTGKKMGKTEGNMVNLDENPKEIYGKIMSWPDGLIELGFELLTDVSLEEVKKISHPKEAKAKLAKEIIKIFYNEKEAEKAEKEFEKVFKKKELPNEIPEIKIKEEKINILDLLVRTKLVSSKSEAQRLILQGGVKINNEVKKNWREIIEIKKGLIIQIGKRRFIKII